MSQEQDLWENPLQIVCPICSAAVGEPCFKEEEPPFETPGRGGIHVGRMTGGGNLSLLAVGDGTFMAIEN